MRMDPLNIFVECVVIKPVNIFIMVPLSVTPVEPFFGESRSKEPNPRFATKSVLKWVSVP